MASIDRTAYPRFKRVVPVRELNEAFTPTADEVAWAGDRSLGDSNVLSLVVLLKSYQRLGISRTSPTFRPVLSSTSAASWVWPSVSIGRLRLSGR